MKNQESIIQFSKSNHNSNTQIMKTTFITFLALLMFALSSQPSIAQTTESNSDLAMKSTEVLMSMLEDAPDIQAYYNNSYGYAVFPKVTKGGITIGAAAGKGVVYKNHEIVSASKFKQFTLGYQFGVQQYSEVIFFQNEEAFAQFMNKKVKLDAQASAVAFKAGSSGDATFTYGIGIFTQPIGGLMFEAAVGLQCFKNEPISN